MVSEWVYYCQFTGEVRWKKSPSNSIHKDSLAGCPYREGGYLRTVIKGKPYFNHHIAFILMGKKYDVVDHINGDKTDNRWLNLRSVSASGNQRNRALNKNNLTGVTGVTVHPSGLYHAYIKVNGKRINLLYTRDLFDAICARMSANIKYNFHSNHGRR